MNAASPNKLFFETTSITITDTRFDTGRDSFPIRKISGVRVESGKRHTRTGISLVVAGLAALLSGMLGNVAVLIVLGAAFTVGGAMLCVARVNRTLVITTRGRDVRALTSKDSALIQAVTSALQEAIADRGV